MQHESPQGIKIDPRDPAYSARPVTGEPATQLPKVYVFSTSPDGEGVAYCIAESGHVLGMHYCSSLGYAEHDLTKLPRRVAELEAHYPGGYEVVVLPLGTEPPDEVKRRNLELPEDEA